NGRRLGCAGGGWGHAYPSKPNRPSVGTSFRRSEKPLHLHFSGSPMKQRQSCRLSDPFCATRAGNLERALVCTLATLLPCEGFGRTAEDILPLTSTWCSRKWLTLHVRDNMTILTLTLS
ncbi:unnamed protein product, partial [Laminaria digitata]